VPNEANLRLFIDRYVENVANLAREYSLAYFTSSASGKKEDYEKAKELKIELNRIRGNKDDFLKLKAFRESGQIRDGLLLRQLDVIYLTFLENQIDEAAFKRRVDLETKVRKQFSDYKAAVGGRELSDSQLNELFKQSSDSAQVEAAWTAKTAIAGSIAGDILILVELRNEAAKNLGFSNFHEMKLRLSEQDPAEFEKLLDRMDQLTADDYQAAKAEVDRTLAQRFGIREDQLRPWHYHDLSSVYDLDLDKYYKDKDVVEIARAFYADIGLPIDDLIAKSDLFEREGKGRQIFSINIGKEGDIRVLANVKSNSKSMYYLLHEFGHAVFRKNIDRSLPWLLRDPAAESVTEAVSMMFDRLVSDPVWLRDVVGISGEEYQKIADQALKAQRLQRLFLNRQMQVMVRFEKAMYENPHQDLNKLWWDLTEKYLMVKRPENQEINEWASKIHIALYPAYYPNYMTAEVLASQFQHYIAEHISGDSGFAGKTAIGEYLIQNVYGSGKTLPWRELVRRATGEDLTEKYHASFLSGTVKALQDYH